MWPVFFAIPLRMCHHTNTRGGKPRRNDDRDGGFPRFHDCCEKLWVHSSVSVAPCTSWSIKHARAEVVGAVCVAGRLHAMFFCWSLPCISIPARSLRTTCLGLPSHPSGERPPPPCPPWRTYRCCGGRSIIVGDHISRIRGLGCVKVVFQGRARLLVLTHVVPKRKIDNASQQCRDIVMCQVFAGKASFHNKQG